LELKFTWVLLRRKLILKAYRLRKLFPHFLILDVVKPLLAFLSLGNLPFLLEALLPVFPSLKGLLWGKGDIGGFPSSL